MITDHTDGIRKTLDLARSVSSDEVPVAAIVADASGYILGTSTNRVFEQDDPSAHAEIEVIRELGRSSVLLGRAELTMYVNLEPCPMCAWAIGSIGFGRLIFGSYNPIYGACGSVFDLIRDSRFGGNTEVIGGVLEEECSQLLNSFWKRLRDNS